MNWDLVTRKREILDILKMLKFQQIIVELFKSKFLKLDL